MGTVSFLCWMLWFITVKVNMWCNTLLPGYQLIPCVLRWKVFLLRVIQFGLNAFTGWTCFPQWVLSAHVCNHYINLPTLFISVFCYMHVSSSASFKMWCVLCKCPWQTLLLFLFLLHHFIQMSIKFSRTLLPSLETFRAHDPNTGYTAWPGEDWPCRESERFIKFITSQVTTCDRISGSVCK